MGIPKKQLIMLVDIQSFTDDWNSTTKYDEAQQTLKHNKVSLCDRPWSSSC